MEYYLEAGTHTDVLDDKLVGRSIGWNKQKVGDYRRKLIESNWIHFEKYDGKDEVSVIRAWFTPKDVLERKDWLAENKKSNELEKILNKKIFN